MKTKEVLETSQGSDDRGSITDHIIRDIATLQDRINALHATIVAIAPSMNSWTGGER